jgi:hypothetical protein
VAVLREPDETGLHETGRGAEQPDPASPPVFAHSWDEAAAASSDKA